MSTYLRLACLDHDPRLTCYNEIEQHISEEIIEKIKSWVSGRMFFINSVRLADSFVDWGDRYLNTAIGFLTQHPTCRIGLVTEYGDWVDVGYGTPDGLPVYQDPRQTKE